MSWISPDPDVRASGTGGGGTIGNQTTIFPADTTIIHADGALHALPLVPVIVPPWMDGASHITAPGLYTFGVTVDIENARTTPGLSALIAGVRSSIVGMSLVSLPGSIADRIVIDGLTFWESQEVQAIGVLDLPFHVGWTIQMPTDVSLNLNFQPYAGLLYTP